MTTPAVSRRAALALGGATLASTLFPRRSDACFNDRDVDKLADEAKGLPGIVEIITGRFERNPALFYQMRIDRIEEDLPHNPLRPNLYDDAAVASDRIGESDDAIAWLQSKRNILEGTTPSMPKYHEAWYRYYANIGTSRVHRWIRGGAKPGHIAEVEAARDEIIHALKIKPDAHFGREAYQLQVMEWIIRSVKHRTTESLGSVLEVRDGLRPVSAADADGREGEVVKGLAGLIVLGNAWESVDVFDALADWLDREQNKSMAQLARYRAEEIANHGGKSFLGGEGYDPVFFSPYIDTNLQKRLKREYVALRAESDQWQKARTDYMMVRLQAGRHPDTDPTFWNEWHPAPAPKLSQDPPKPHTLPEPPVERSDYQFAGKVTFGIAALAIAGAVLRYRSRSTRLTP